MKINYTRTERIIEMWFCILTKNENTGDMEIRPFLLRPYQKRVLKEIVENGDKNILAEKTRQMGFSWLLAAYFTVLFLFGKNEQMLVLGKKESFIDNAGLDVNTLLGKVKFILENLRDDDLSQMLNLTITLKGKKVKVLETKYLFIKNNLRNNVITGESSTGKSGRGATYTQVWWDETAFTERSDLIFASIAPNSKRLYLISTANGKNNVFYKIKRGIESGESSRKWFKVRVHWSEFFDEAWYELQKEVLHNDPVLIAQELDIDYETSGGIKIFHNFTKRNFRDEVMFQSGLLGTTVTGFDFGINDKNTACVIQYQWNFESGKPEFYIVDSYEVRNVPFALIFQNLYQPNEYSIQDMAYRCRPEEWESLNRFLHNNLIRGYLRAHITGDHAATARSLQTGYSIAQMFNDNGLIFDSWSLTEKEEQVLSLIRSYQPQIHIASYLPEMRNMVFGWEYESNRDGDPVRVGHNRYSDMGDAFKYAMLWIFMRIFGGLEYVHQHSRGKNNLFE